MTISPVRKAIFPVAGLGTRLLPATKTMPKEMLTIVDRPTIQLQSDEIEKGARLRALQPMPLSVPQAITRAKREQDITRPARPSKLSVWYIVAPSLLKAGPLQMW